MSRRLLEAVERIAEELNAEERLKLAKDLVQQAQRDRWDRLFQSIDQKRKERRFTMAEINTEIEAYRRARRARPH